MEIRSATTSPTPIPTAASTPGTGLPTTGWYAPTGDVRPRAVVLGACSAPAARRTAGLVDRAAVRKAVVVAVMTNAAVQQHLPFLPLQGIHPRGAPV